MDSGEFILLTCLAKALSSTANTPYSISRDEPHSVALGVWELHVHIVTKIFVILNLVVCLVLSQYVWISLAGNVQWREAYENERDARHRDKSLLSDAYNELLAARASSRDASSQSRAELSGLSAALQTLEAWQSSEQDAAAAAGAAHEDLMAAVGPFDDISNEYTEDLAGRLEEVARQLDGHKNRVLTDRGQRLLDVARGRNDYARHHEAYRELEFQHFLLQEELEDRRDLKARYRWLRPDIQRELGDNGPVVMGTVDWAVGNSIQINKGRRDGVELYQKYTIRRGGNTIGVVNIVEVQNETAEAVILDLVDEGVKPREGDEALTRLFMSRRGR